MWKFLVTKTWVVTEVSRKLLILMLILADVDKTLYELLSESNVRVWVHAGLDRDAIKALKSMRPDPSFYAIIGSTQFITETYRRVSFLFNIVLFL